MTGLSLLFSIAACDNNDSESAISAAELPAPVDVFVNTYFPNATYLSVKKQNRQDSDGSLYEVKLTNHFDIDFDINGHWIDIDGNHQQVPDELIPEKIKAYVSLHFPNLFIAEIDNENTYIDIDLSNDQDLRFSKNGDFIKLDKK